MSSAPKSRWADDDAETQAYIEQKKREKEEKKRAKAEKQRQIEEAARKKLQATVAGTDTSNGSLKSKGEEETTDPERPTKRRRLSGDHGDAQPVAEDKPTALLRFPSSEWGPCRHVDNYERLNAIEEGSYGWVSRAKDVTTGEIVAIKKLKMDNTYDGFPVTGLREIQTLHEARHPHIVKLREVVMGDKMDE